MKTKTFGLIALLAIWCLTLAGCNKSETETANPASTYCEENGGTLLLQEGEWLCIFDDGTYCEEWSFYRDECKKWEIIYNTVDEEDYVLPEWAKTSLTTEELDELAETHFPKSYTYTTYNMETGETWSWESTYPEDLSHTLLIPEHATMASREVVSSGIEDGMIYTLTKVVLQDGTELQVLYIVNPETLDFVAVSVENGNETINYQFAY